MSDAGAGGASGNSSAAAAPPSPPSVPAPRPYDYQNLSSAGTIEGNMDLVHLGRLTGAAIEFASNRELDLKKAGATLILNGVGFTYDVDQQLTGGTVGRILFGVSNPDFFASVSFQGASAAPFAGWVATDATGEAFSTLLAGRDYLHGNTTSADDLIRGYAGDDILAGQGGADTIFGGTGDDQIYAAGSPLDGTTTGYRPGPTYLRGEEGDDYIRGAADFDYINGNQGNDTADGGAGNDWVLGGKDDDLLFGGAGNDVINGNLGIDTIAGGEGSDTVRGGQGDDLIFGETGNDWLSGDLGDDTIVGGAGADTIHAFAGIGLDRVVDFSASEGDRVQLDPGTSYSVAQVGDDTVITLTGGGQVVLAGVQLNTLPDGWLWVG